MRLLLFSAARWCLSGLPSPFRFLSFLRGSRLLFHLWHVRKTLDKSNLISHLSTIALQALIDLVTELALVLLQLDQCALPCPHVAARMDVADSGLQGDLDVLLCVRPTPEDSVAIRAHICDPHPS